MTPRAHLDHSGDAVATAAEARKARFWDRIARKYAADPIADAAGYEATLRRVQGLLSPEHTVLEIGCGTGTTALRLAHATRRYLATDLSSEMIAIARERQAAAPQVLPQLQFVRADAERPDPGGETFDAVLAFNVLHLVDDLDRTIALVVRALRPGGRFIAKTPCIGEMNPLIPCLALPLMKLFGKAPPVLSFDAAALQAAIERQGLVVEAVERHGTRGKDCRPFIVARAPGGA
jgi:SAM-dependent methyltransferase